MIGTRIGPYEVTGALGRGGMGEVYRARDDRLGRDVAIKVLPPEFASNEERLARFQREARLLAVLQHQNIASIYGLEELDGVPVLVMELVEGDDLSLRLGGSILPGDEIEKLVRQLAAGLEYAHEQGIVHRDLKPANLKVTTGGELKILDFGLARAFEGTPGGSSMNGSSGDTITVVNATDGSQAMLGTAAYMSPEQTRGYAVDRRADIWAFGVILFEMLTGQRLFAGETTSDILAAVLRKDPDWELVPADAPAVLVQICRRCLERDPQRRLRDIGEVRIALESGTTSMLGRMPDLPSESPAGGTARGRGRPVATVVAAVAVAACLAVGGLGLTGRIGPQPAPPRLVRSTVVLPDGMGVLLNPSSPGAPVVSPDGLTLAFVGQDSAGVIQLCFRALDAEEVHVVPGTRGASYPFWGPDSRSLAYFGGGQLFRVDIGGGPVQAICATENAKWGSWSARDEILFTPSHGSSIFRVPATGGEPVEVTDLASEENARSHRFPRWLPDGEHFLYHAWFRGSAGNRSPESVLRVASSDGSLNRDLMPCQSSADFSAGHVLYLHEENLMSRPFSLTELEFTGPPRALMGDVLILGGAHFGAFTATDAGVLAYMARGGSFGQARLAWTVGDEKETLIERSRSILGFELSPDGTRVAVSLVDDQAGSFDLWIHEIERSLATRFTFAAESEYGPSWSSDGRWIAYTGEQDGVNVIFRKPVSGGGRPEALVTMDTDVTMGDWSPDGGTIAFTKAGAGGEFSVWLLELAEGAEPRPFAEKPYNMGMPAFSPDGRWLAYVTDETGQVEVFVESLVPDGGRWRISSNTGSLPEWSADGSRIYFVEDSGNLMATEIIQTGDGLAIGRTTRVTGGVVNGLQPTYSEDPASGRILVQIPAQGSLNDRIELVTGWQNLLAEGDR